MEIVYNLYGMLRDWFTSLPATVQGILIALAFISVIVWLLRGTSSDKLPRTITLDHMNLPETFRVDLYHHHLDELNIPEDFTLTHKGISDVAKPAQGADDEDVEQRDMTNTDMDKFVTKLIAHQAALRRLADDEVDADDFCNAVVDLKYDVDRFLKLFS